MQSLFLTAGCLLTFALPVSAQAPKPDKTVPVSVSTYRKGKTGQKSALKKPITQKALADAILAEMLGALIEQSDEHFHNGEYNHTVATLRYIVQGDPQNLEAYSNAAYLLWSTDRFDEGTEFLKQGLKANPHSYWMYDELGMHFGLRKKDYAASLGWYQKAVRFPCPSSTYHGLAACYERLNQWENALKTWEKAATYKDDALAPARVKRVKQKLGIKS